MSKKSKTQDGSDVSRSPSKSPTPRRASSDDQHSPLSNDDIDDREKMGRLEEEAEDLVDQLQHDVRDIRDIRDDLPPYLPSIYGCRSVEEFQCLNRIEEGMNFYQKFILETGEKIQTELQRDFY